MLRQAGCDIDALVAKRVSPALLESHIRFRRELRVGEEVDVTCTVSFDCRSFDSRSFDSRPFDSWSFDTRSADNGGRTFSMDNTIRRSDGTVSAEIVSILGLLDLDRRRLVPDVRARLASLATRPEVLLGSTDQ
jgi:acyl-CoA thioester hydrolase